MSRRGLAVGLLTLAVLGTLAYHLDAAWHTRADAIQRRDVARRRLRSMEAERNRQTARLATARRSEKAAAAAHDQAALTVDQRNAELKATVLGRRRRPEPA